MLLGALGFGQDVESLWVSSCPWFKVSAQKTGDYWVIARVYQGHGEEKEHGLINYDLGQNAIVQVQYYEHRQSSYPLLRVSISVYEMGLIRSAFQIRDNNRDGKSCARYRQVSCRLKQVFHWLHHQVNCGRINTAIFLAMQLNQIKPIANNTPNS